MKQLQNNFTTVEQSKRLLELGLPADSADCSYNNSFGFIFVASDKTKEYWKQNGNEHLVPCWSVGRLIEIYEVCTGHKFKRLLDKNGKLIYVILLYDVLAQIEYSIINSVDGVRWDFLKLEE